MTSGKAIFIFFLGRCPTLSYVMYVKGRRPRKKKIALPDVIIIWTTCTLEHTLKIEPEGIESLNWLCWLKVYTVKGRILVKYFMSGKFQSR